MLLALRSLWESQVAPPPLLTRIHLGGLAVIEDHGGFCVLEIGGTVVARAKSRHMLELMALNAGCTRILFQ
jgi:hypothetical protein